MVHVQCHLSEVPLHKKIMFSNIMLYCVSLPLSMSYHIAYDQTYIDFKLVIRKERKFTLARQFLRSHKAGSESGYSTRISNSSLILYY